MWLSLIQSRLDTMLPEPTLRHSNTVHVVIFLQHKTIHGIITSTLKHYPIPTILDTNLFAYTALLDYNLLKFLLYIFCNLKGGAITPPFTETCEHWRVLIIEDMLSSRCWLLLTICVVFICRTNRWPKQSIWFLLSASSWKSNSSLETSQQMALKV